MIMFCFMEKEQNTSRGTAPRIKETLMLLKKSTGLFGMKMIIQRVHGKSVWLRSIMTSFLKSTAFQILVDTRRTR
ncbi:hypothetical protein OS493_011816 [Desmophyllum pertusum]|uniref:Uncharacterized protein n=1 Tax=Desmophyllum pertusum TaxID=174260 RepID=A0A9W9YE36_9CNID|nr:hypothetical protein OS493_011816 [Desmophyllum pertusum]